eukprot:6210823-Pleurochrysis_carterae.AAC.1
MHLRGLFATSVCNTPRSCDATLFPAAASRATPSGINRAHARAAGVACPCRLQLDPPRAAVVVAELDAVLTHDEHRRAARRQLETRLSKTPNSNGQRVGARAA